MTDDERLVKLLQKASELGFTVVYTIDHYSGVKEPHKLHVTSVRKAYGTYVANGPVPMADVPKFLEEATND